MYGKTRMKDKIKVISLSPMKRQNEKTWNNSKKVLGYTPNRTTDKIIINFSYRVEDKTYPKRNL